MPWSQTYNPTGSAILSTLVAAIPVVVLLGTIGFLHVRIHLAALLGLAVALVVALFVYGMPVRAAAATTLYGAAYGLFPIGWIILNLIFLYQLTVEKGLFAVLRGSLGRLTPDPRVQVILIAFSFGARATVPFRGPPGMVQTGHSTVRDSSIRRGGPFSRPGSLGSS